MRIMGRRQSYAANRNLEKEKRRQKLVDIFTDLKIKTGMSINDISDNSGLSRTTIHNLLSTKQLGFSEKAISALEKCFGVTIDRESLEVKENEVGK